MGQILYNCKRINEQKPTYSKQISWLTLYIMIMKIKSNYKLRKIAGVPIIVKQGTRDVDLTHVISLNKSAKFLYESFLEKEFELNDVANLLESTFNITHERAEKDAKIWVDSMKECQVIE